MNGPRSRTVSPAGLNLVARFEGFVPTPYNDAAGNATIGFGHLIHPGPVAAADRLHWGSLSHEVAADLLRTDLGAAVASVNGSLHSRLALAPSVAQARFDALVSLAFNIGGGAFAGSSLLRAINQRGAPRDWASVGPLWLAWSHAAGHVLPGLLHRRQVELHTFLTGRYPTP